MRIFRKFRILLFMTLIGLVIGFSQQALAEDIILNDLNGQAVNISSYKGKPVVLFFWTTWCPYCRVELKKLNQQSSVMEKEGIVVLGINVRESSYKVKKFFDNYQLNLKILLDQDGLLARKYDLMGVPTFVFLDKAQEVIAQVNNLPDDYKSILLK